MTRKSRRRILRGEKNHVEPGASTFYGFSKRWRDLHYSLIIAQIIAYHLCEISPFYV